MGDAVTGPTAASDSADHRVLVSVVIATKNRARLLGEVIRSLWAQTLPPEQFEIIVVDNRSTDETPGLVRQWGAQSPCRLIYHVMPVDRGPVPSRNAGVQLARGEFVAFTDSDCRVHPEWLARGVAAFRDGAAFVTGTLANKPEQPVGMFSRTNQYVGENPTYPMANIFYRRAAFVGAGGLNESLCWTDLLTRCTECADTDLAWRLKKQGLETVFASDVIVYHEVETLTLLHWVLDPIRIFVLPALLKRHPELRGLLLRWGVFWVPRSYYLAAFGIVASIFVHPAFLILITPFLYQTTKQQAQPVPVARLPLLVAQGLLMGVRETVMCLGVLYGSIRFRTLVL